MLLASNLRKTRGCAVRRTLGEPAAMARPMAPVRQDVPMATSADQQPPRELPPGVDAVAANADSVTPIPPPLSSVPTTKTVLTAGWVTGSTAGIVCLLIRLISGIFGVDYLVARPGSDQMEPVPWLVVLLLPLVVGVVGSLIAAIFLGVRGCQRWTFWLGTAAMLASLSGPFLQPGAVTWPTRIWLGVMHVVTWAIIVPQVARVVGDSDPRVTAGYREVLT